MKAKSKRFNVLSPDGIPITREPFRSKQAALSAHTAWLKRYEANGYYLTSSWERIPLAEIAGRCELVEA